ncbi:gamma-glutamyltransferase [soil metagenome]
MHDSDDPEPPPPESSCKQPDVMRGRRGAIATGHGDSSAAGLRVLDRGGNVVDAALAASAVMAVVMPHATTIGGDAFMLVRDATTGTVHGLNASGTAPAGAGPHLFSEGMKQRGGLAPVVPGLVRGWEALHRRFCSLPWQALLDGAIGAAESGFVANESLADSVSSSMSLLLGDPGCAALFTPGGKALNTGQRVTQAALAQTLKVIATEGASALHGGAAGRAVTSHLRQHGGCMALQDLADYRADWVEPLCVSYRNHRLHVMPPNSMGVLMLMQLRALATLPLDSITGNTIDRMLWQIRAMRASFKIALEEIGDPRSMRLSGHDLLVDEISKRVQDLMHGDLAPALPAKAGGTACVTVADAAGNAACIVQSTFNPFGAHLLDPETGILFNNRMFNFDHRQGRVNSVGPGKRSAHTLNPVIATEAGRLSLVHASPGGVSQTITGTQILMNVIDRRLDLPHAIGDGRWAVDRQGNILIEPTVPSALLPVLRGMGLVARQVDDPYFYGSPTAIQLSPDGALCAVADARRQGAALAF